MALDAVSSVINSTLVPLLMGEVKLLRNVHTEVASIKAELESIMSFLKDADSSRELENERAKIWVKQVRDIAYEIEDVMDGYALNLAKEQQQHGFVGAIHKFSRSITQLKPKHDIASQIPELRRKIRRIKERADSYGLSSLGHGSSSKTQEEVYDDPRVASLFIEEGEVVGVESTREELIQRLIDGERKRTVTSLVGMGGCGKSTLVKTVFDDPRVSKHFECQVLVSVSQSYNTMDILRRMMKQLCEGRKEDAIEGIERMDQYYAIHRIKELLIQKRFLIIFDDVWSNEFWRFIRPALPKNENGSRIIVTTRSQGVASFCKGSSLDRICMIEPLTEKEAWKLFCMKAFGRDFGGCCPPELKEVSLAIIKKCEGLPLAIVTIGALLSTKSKVVYEWQRFVNSLGSELERNSDLTNVKKILLLSYNDLPYYLKPCFLYFGMILEGNQISLGRLIRSWIAEGFIRGEKGKTLEEVAEEYLIELVSRSLVQGLEIGVDGRIRTCKVHDIVHEIILTKCEELSFSQVLGEVDPRWTSETRRWSMHMEDVTNRVLANLHRTESKIRSIFLSSAEELTDGQLLSCLASNFKLLKLIDLQGAPVCELSKEVGKLFHLRYLNVKGTKVKKVPKSIGNLYNLQTLNMNYSSVEVLQSGILSKLHKLRHLSAWTYPSAGVKIEGRIGHLEELQTLCGVLDTDQVNELQNLRQLRKLFLACLKRESGKVLCEAIEKMKHLRYLRVLSTGTEEILDLQSISSPPEYLQFLYLSGHLEILPSWILKLNNLVSLGLYFSNLTTCVTEPLQALPNLKEFYFWGCCGEQLCFYGGGFPKLKLLDLAYSEGLESVIIEEGGLTVLEELSIRCCPQVKDEPSGIRNLRKLKHVCFSEMSREFCDRMKSYQGQDYWAGEHIPKVIFSGEPCRYTPQEYLDTREGHRQW